MDDQTCDPSDQAEEQGADEVLDLLEPSVVALALLPGVVPNEQQPWRAPPMQTTARPDVAADIPHVPIDASARQLVEGNADDALLLAKAPKVGRR